MLQHPAIKSIPQPQTCAPSRPQPGWGNSPDFGLVFLFLTEQCLISSPDLFGINQDETMQVTKNYLLIFSCFHDPNRKRWLGQFREALDTRAELGVISLQPKPFLWEICTSEKLAQSRAIALLALSRQSSAVSLASPPKQTPAAGGTCIILLTSV